MAPLNIFGKKLKGENRYFKSRSADTRKEQSQTQLSTQPEPPPEVEKNLISDRLINKDLFTELLKDMRLHDINATVVILSNTIDCISRRAGIMINKGYIPKRVVTYLQNINLSNIDDAIKLVKTGDPDENGFFQVDERMAANLNLPLGCMLLGIFHRIKKNFGLILVLKTNLKHKKEFVEKIQKRIQR